LGATPGVSAGEDRTSQQIGIINGSMPGPISIHVGASLQRWVNNPSGNKGWVFIPNDAGGVRVASSEATNVMQRPMLTVTFD
jgi:hypothetical protein